MSSNELNKFRAEVREKAAQRDRIVDLCTTRVAQLNEMITAAGPRDHISINQMTAERSMCREILALAGVAVLLAFAACATEPELPTCSSLGASPTESLPCTHAGLCVYNGERCRVGVHVTPIGSAGSDEMAGSGDASDGCAAVVGACAPCDDFAAWAQAGTMNGGCVTATCPTADGGTADFQACKDPL